MTGLQAPGANTGWFEKDRFGLFVHWGTYALAARHEWVRKIEGIPAEDYRKYFSHFEPDLYDPGEWARLAREAGMKYFVVTAKHHEGFCLWDSEYTDYKSTQTPYGRDVLRPMIEAFRGEGLKVGLYYSLLDWNHPEFTVDNPYPRSNDEAVRRESAGRDIRKYAEYLHNQTRELLTGFGKIDLLWYDFSYPGEGGKGREDWQSETLMKLVRELQPEILVNNRLDLPGRPDFLTPEQFVPDACPLDEEGQPMVWEGCQTLSGSWGYHRDESTWKTNAMLIRMLVDHVSKGGNLLLNVGPTARGNFDHRAVNALKGIGEWMKLHERSIYGCTYAPDGLKPPPDCRYTYNPQTRRLYVHVFAWPFKHLHLAGLSDRVAYAQLLNDASEIRIHEKNKNADGASHDNLRIPLPDDALTLLLPVVAPNVDVPVIELFLK